MDNLENDLNEIMTEAMNKITDERLKHQQKCASMLESRLWENHGAPARSQLFGIKPVAIGKEQIELMTDQLCLKHKVIDATIDEPNDMGVMGLMELMACGEGDDIYEALNSMVITTSIAEKCDGLMIRVPCEASAKNESKRYDSVVTCLALENTISVIMRVLDPAETVQQKVFDIDTYKLGDPNHKLIDAVYLAYFLPRYLKSHDNELYKMIQMYTAWRLHMEGNATEGE